MINYTCDLCGEKCNGREFALPVAATWINGDPCDLMPVNMNLCKECRNEIYKLMESRKTTEKMKTFNRQALEVKMNR